MSTHPTILADNDKEYSRDDYDVTSKSIRRNQREVAEAWADCELPAHNTTSKACVINSKSRNLKGYQYPDGSGKLMHYNHIEAIRTKSGLVIGDTSCYAIGFAKCTKPHDTDFLFDITSLKEELRGKDYTVYDIVGYNDGIVEFGGGEHYDLTSESWV